MTRLVCGGFLLVALCAGPLRAAEAVVPARQAAGDLARLWDLQTRDLLRAADDPYLHRLWMDAVLTRVWQFDHTNALVGLLNDFHLRPKVFHASGADANAVLGFEYTYAKSLAGRVIHPEGRDPLGLSLNLEAQGNVAFDAAENPDSFLDSAVSFHLFQGIGGVEPLLSTEGAAAAQADLARRATTINKRGDSLRADPAFQAATRDWADHVMPQFFYDIAGRAGLEADQEFRRKQWTYGGRAGLSYRDWRSAHWVSWLNLPDYPFALVRFLTSRDPFQPSGHAFPTLLGAVERVDPTDDLARRAVEPGAESYLRLQGQIAFKTAVGTLWGTDLWFSAGYRVYQEIDAPQGVRAADLDRSESFVARLDLPRGFNLSYSTGRLPLDEERDDVIALGYTLKF